MALYDYRDRRGWLVSALDVILHILHVRHFLEPYTVQGEKVNISFSDNKIRIPYAAAREALAANFSQIIYDRISLVDKEYRFRDAVLDVLSLLDRLTEKDEDMKATPGTELRGTMQSTLQGWEFMSLVEESNLHQKEQVIRKSSGGWVDLIQDIDAVVLFGTGFGEVVKPASSSGGICPQWQNLPKDKDYLAIGCPMLESLYAKAGSRRTHMHLTSTHLQWHRRRSLFERCILSAFRRCDCDRLQQLLYDSKMTLGRIQLPSELAENGCVIFGRSHLGSRSRRKSIVRKRTTPDGPQTPLHKLKTKVHTVCQVNGGSPLL